MHVESHARKVEPGDYYQLGETLSIDSVIGHGMETSVNAYINHFPSR